MKKFVFLITVLLIVLPHTVTAQVDPDLFDFVTTAFEKTRTLSSMRVEIEETIRQSVSTLGLFTISKLENKMTGEVVFVDESPNVEMTLEQIYSNENVNPLTARSEVESAARSINITELDDQIFVRVLEADPRLAEPFSEEWMDVTANLPDYVPAIQQFTDLMTAGLDYPLTTTYITSITELATDETGMRVFEIVMDWERLVLTSGEEYTFLEYLAWDLSGETEGEFRLTVWISEASEFVHRVDAYVKSEREVERSTLQQGTVGTLNIMDTVAISFRYFDFNEEFEIATPNN
jgi:hypothetical protein